jgi:hypothetical protein
MPDLKELAGRIMTDPEFATSLSRDPEMTLREAGYEPTPELLAAIREVDAESLTQMAAAFGERDAAV